MDTIEKVKIAWREKFGSEIPDQFVTRLECGLSKLEHNLEDISVQLYTLVRKETKQKIEELSSSLRKEEYFFEVISSLKDMETQQSSPDPDIAITTSPDSPVYAKVNKPSSSKHESGTATNTHTSSSMSDNSTYEEISVTSYKGDKIIKPKTKMRGSVKAKIKMFERSDSSSGEEVAVGMEGEYARLAVRPMQAPPVSPKPSPAIRRKPPSGDYEEITLPGLSSNTTEIATPSSPPPANKPSAHNLPPTQEDCQIDKRETLSNQPNKTSTSLHGKKPAPPVPLRRSRCNESINSGDSDVLKKTEELTLQYSEHEPQLATSRKPRCTEQAIKSDQKSKVDNIHVQKRVDRHSDGIEGEYCDIADIKKPVEKHVTLVQVVSSNNKPENGAILNVKCSDKELSRSHDQLHRISGNNDLSKSSSVSKSLENFKQFDNDVKNDNAGDVDDGNCDSDDDYEVIGEKQPEPDDKKMKKIFHRRNSGSITSEKSVDDGNQEAVVGTRYKSLSGSESEEDLLGTVVVNVADMVSEKDKGEVDQEINEDDNNDADELSDSDSKGESEASKSPEIERTQHNRKRVPDYEKWTFQNLLTKTGISIADNDFTDTGSEDDTIYDNNTPARHDFHEQQTGQSDDSGVLVTEPSSDTRDDDQSSITEMKPTKKSASDDLSRMSVMSTASCVTVDGDAMFLQRSDSIDSHIKVPTPDEVSLFSLEDQIDGKSEEGSPDDHRMSYQSEQLRMRHLVVKGILESEKSYLHVIDQLVKAKHYLQSVAMRPTPGVIALEDVTTIFYKMDDFHHIHKEFIDDLEEKLKHWSDDQQIAEPVKKLVFYFKAYEEYVQNYPVAVETIKKYQRNEETKHLLEEQMDSFKEEALKLEDVLLKPVQRIQTNHLVLHDLIMHTPESHPDHPILRKALKLSEENLRMYNVNPTVAGDNKGDVRQLIKSGFLVEVSQDKKSSRHLRYVFLFSDVLICTKHKGSVKHKDVYFKYDWSIPLTGLSMHKKGNQKYQPKETLDELKNKIGNLKVELREEMLRADSKSEKHFNIGQKRAARNVEKLKKKIQELEATLVEALPRLPLNLEVETFRSHTFLFSTDYEREEWREAIYTQSRKCADVPAAQFSKHECEVMVANTKLHTQVNGIGTVLLKKDEEMLTGNLSVTIHKMQGLDKPCDVYCCIEMDSYGHFYKKAQTGVSHFDSDASWNQDFDLELDGSQTLRILCYRKQPGDETTDIVIGKCALELSLHWLNSKFNEKTIQMNEISITVSIRHNPASKTLKRTQSKLRTGIFGVKIENVCRRENKTVPSIVATCVQQVENRGIGEVGIYRVSGVTSEIQHLKKLFDKNPIAASTQADEADIHTITGVLKLYLRELPEPLFTDSAYQSFVQTNRLQNADTKEKVMLELLHELPDANYYTIVYMLEHLVRIAKRSDENKMSLSNLSTIFGPTLMHPAVKDTNIDPMVQMARAAKDAEMQTTVIYYFLGLASSGKNLRRSASS